MGKSINKKIAAVLSKGGEKEKAEALKLLEMDLFKKLKTKKAQTTKEMKKEEKVEKEMNGIETEGKSLAQKLGVKLPKEHEPFKVHKCKNPECPQTGKPQVAMSGYCSESKYKKGNVVELSAVAAKSSNMFFKFPALQNGKCHLVSAPSVQEACYILADNREKEANPQIKAEQSNVLLPRIWMRSLEYFKRAAHIKLAWEATEAPKGVHGINVPVNQDPNSLN